MPAEAEEGGYRHLEIPADAPFELKPAGSGKGWGVFATRPIKENELILKEAPVIRFTIPPHLITNNVLEKAVKRLPRKQRRQIYSLRLNGEANAKFQSLLECFAENEFSTSWAGGGEAWGLFLLSSRLNHSCIPNARFPTNTSKGLYNEVYAVKYIGF
ncbi:hypothetical protein V8F06_012752 [Rhypophila decipiens]